MISVHPKKGLDCMKLTRVSWRAFFGILEDHIMSRSLRKAATIASIGTPPETSMMEMNCLAIADDKSLAENCLAISSAMQLQWCSILGGCLLAQMPPSRRICCLIYAWPALCCMVQGQCSAGAQAIPLPDAGELTREPGPLPKAAARTSVYFEVSSSGRCCTVTEGSGPLRPDQMSSLDTERLNTTLLGKGWCSLTKASCFVGLPLPAPPS